MTWLTDKLTGFFLAGNDAAAKREDDAEQLTPIGNRTLRADSKTRTTIACRVRRTDELSAGSGHNRFHRTGC